MRTLLTGLFLCSSVAAWCQKDSAYAVVPFQRNTIIATGSVGFVDLYRKDFEYPAGFEKGNVTGFLPLNAKLEYGFANHWSIAASLGYDHFQYNYSQLYTGFNGIIKRPRVNNVQIFAGGVTLYYHLDKVIKVKRLDPFIGVGLALNNIRYSAWPQGDSTVIRKEHTVTPYLKVGARYYITNNFSVFGDVGYEKMNIVNVGFSLRFCNRRIICVPPTVIKD